LSLRQSEASGLHHAFYPESIAVIGASANEEAERSEGWLGRLRQFGYQGRLYPINPRASQIMGMKAYASVTDVAEDVDYAIITVPASLVPRVLGECVAKGVKFVHIHTGGFADALNEEGSKLNDALAEVIKGSNTRVIGPNCLGVYCPSGGLTFITLFPRVAGPVAILAQTASALIGLIPIADARGIHFSKVVSYGNALDLDSPDFLEYLADDPDTRYVMAYIEGVKDGQRFLKSVARCNSRKPVIILKAGVTQGGARAVTSHTASLVGAEHVWEAFFKQTHAIAVESFDEALNQLVAFHYLKPPAGRRVGIVGLGGGWSVVTTDICEREGLLVPALSDESTRNLEKMKGLEVGRGIRNPVEVGLGKFGLSKEFVDALKITAADSQIDFLLIQLYPGGYVQQWAGGNQMDKAMDTLIDTVKGLPKPVVMVIGLGYDPHSMTISVNAHKRCYEAGLPVFYAPDTAARAVSKLIGYYENRTS